jgi:hypothetical protein
MAMSASGMAADIIARMAAVGSAQYEGSDGAAGAMATAEAQLEAMCQGIIDHIQAHAVVTTTSGAPDGEHIGNIT